MTVVCNNTVIHTLLFYKRATIKAHVKSNILKHGIAEWNSVPVNFTCTAINSKVNFQGCEALVQSSLLRKGSTRGYEVKVSWKIKIL